MLIMGIDGNHSLIKSVPLADLTTKMNRNPLNFAADIVPKIEVISHKVDVFWMKRTEEYPEVAKEPLILLVLFVFPTM